MNNEHDTNQPKHSDNPLRPLNFVNKNERIDISGEKLPHWNQSGCVQFVTFRLADSLPQVKLAEYNQLKEEWLVSHPWPWNDATQEEYNNTIGNKIARWLDAGYGSCLLKDKETRKIIEECILHDDGIKYDIHAYVIMPNHVHVLLTPIEGNLIQNIAGIWKVISSHYINKLRNAGGTVWEKDTFDRMIRSNRDFEAKLNYIVANPKGLDHTSYTLGGDAIPQRHEATNHD